MVRCPSCSRESANDGRFCAWCAAPLDATSAETEVLGPAAGITAAPRLASHSSVDEGRFLPGTVLAGRYRIAGLLGRGGMGEVYRATDLTLGQAVALKFLPETLAQDDRALARFYNEVRIARQVTHPNVCRVHDIGQAEGLHYISMEFVDGEDLASLLRRIGRLPVDKAVETAQRLCTGLAAAHEKGVLHRDLKPANIMIDGRGQVIIMDFGLAGLAEQLQGDIRSGTPTYMSPEQLAGTGVSVKSDIYALGLVMYELFTGKRAFEASSLMELMQMQEQAAPASITTVVKDLDPVVERIIMRCLQRDPRLRPASALAVAAALPGGDPLAAVVAAGETPSPDLVAAAGETEGLPPKLALAWLAATLAGLLIVEVFAPGLCITSKIGLENSPDALTRDAGALLKSFGYTAKPADRAWGLQYQTDYVNYLVRHPSEAARRWKNPAAGQAPLATFWYRESPVPFAAARGFNVAVNFTDPPMEASGLLRLRTDLDGKLQQFEAVPPEVEAPLRPGTAPPPAFEWSRLFQASGLDMSGFRIAEPQWTPLANWDARAAWTGADGQTGAKLRVEAAAWRGRPVFFRIIGPWTVPERMPAPFRTANQVPMQIILYSALFSACALARYQFRAGKSDLRGAWRMGGIYFVFMTVARFLTAHHTATATEVNVFWLTVAVAIINAGAVWVIYLALEPWVRRLWPHTIIGWNRYTAKGIRDPLVGRDLLYGMGFGILMALAILTATAFQGNGGQPFFPPLDPLMGMRHVLAGLLNAMNTALFGAVLSFFLLFGLRTILRKQWIATAAYVVVFAFVQTSGTTTPWVDYPVSAVVTGVMAFVLLRFGLLAAIAATACVQILESGPYTLDASSWYFGLSLAAPMLVALIAIYGFRASLAGR